MTIRMGLSDVDGIRFRDNYESVNLTRIGGDGDGGCLVIEDDAWICADAFIGPGVTVGEGAIVGARAVAMKNVPAQGIVVGNPATELKRGGK